MPEEPDWDSPDWNEFWNPSNRELRELYGGQPNSTGRRRVFYVILQLLLVALATNVGWMVGTVFSRNAGMMAAFWVWYIPTFGIWALDRCDRLDFDNF